MGNWDKGRLSDSTGFHGLPPTVYRTVNKRKWNLWVSQGHIIKDAPSSQPLVVEVASGACMEVENQERRLLCKGSNAPFAFGNHLGTGSLGDGGVAARGVIMSGLLDWTSVEMPDSHMACVELWRSTEMLVFARTPVYFALCYQGQPLAE